MPPLGFLSRRDAKISIYKLDSAPGIKKNKALPTLLQCISVCWVAWNVGCQEIRLNTFPIPQEKKVADWRAVSLVVEQSAMRKCDLDSNSPKNGDMGHYRPVADYFPYRDWGMSRISLLRRNMEMQTSGFPCVPIVS